MTKVLVHIIQNFGWAFLLSNRIVMFQLLLEYSYSPICSLLGVLRYHRKDNGEEYTPRSMTQILSGLQRFINSKRQPDNQVKLCDPSSHQFRALHSVLDRLFRELHRKGLVLLGGSLRLSP